MSARILPHPDLLSCALCGKLTCRIEAERRVFNQYKCACGGGLMAVVASPRPERLIV